MLPTPTMLSIRFWSRFDDIWPLLPCLEEPSSEKLVRHLESVEKGPLKNHYGKLYHRNPHWNNYMYLSVYLPPFLNLSRFMSRILVPNRWSGEMETHFLFRMLTLDGLEYVFTHLLYAQMYFYPWAVSEHFLRKESGEAEHFRHFAYGYGSLNGVLYRATLIFIVPMKSTAWFLENRARVLELLHNPDAEKVAFGQMWRSLRFRGISVAVEMTHTPLKH